MPAVAAIMTPGNGPAGLLDFDFRPPLAPPNKSIAGVTRDATGAALGGCTAKLFRLSDNLLVDQVVSDGSGNYLFGNCSPTETYYIVAYLAGAPDVAGTTVSTLAGV